MIFTALTRLRRYLVISACQPRETNEKRRYPLFRVQLEQLSLQWRRWIAWLTHSKSWRLALTVSTAR